MVSLTMRALAPRLIRNHAQFGNRGVGVTECVVADHTNQICRAAYDSRRWGRIINISSIIAYTGYNGLSVYGATKAAATGFTRSLARERGKVGITVNMIAPGFIATELTKSLSDEQRRRIADRSALRRLTEAEDIASMVELLLGEGGRNITGSLMTVDAGSTA
jgi:NAD(P)-dependent dehydrogenase (short-subunit alcohol dehydrogenase family)